MALDDATRDQLTRFVSARLVEASAFLTLWQTHIDQATTDPEYRAEHLQRAARAAHNAATILAGARSDTATLAADAGVTVDAPLPRLSSDTA